MKQFVVLSVIIGVVDCM